MKSRPRTAVAFVVLGIIALCGLGLVSMLGRAFPGSSDGAYVGEKQTSAAVIMTFFVVYFIFGVIAAFIEKQQARILTLIGAHIAPFLPLPTLRKDDALIFFGAYFVVYLCLSPLWASLVRVKPMGEKQVRL